MTNFYNSLGFLIYYWESKKGTRGFGLALPGRGQGSGGPGRNPPVPQVTQSNGSGTWDGFKALLLIL